MLSRIIKYYYFRKWWFSCIHKQTQTCCFKLTTIISHEEVIVFIRKKNISKYTLNVYIYKHVYSGRDYPLHHYHCIIPRLSQAWKCSIYIPRSPINTKIPQPFEAPLHLHRSWIPTTFKLRISSSGGSQKFGWPFKNYWHLPVFSHFPLFFWMHYLKIIRLMFFVACIFIWLTHLTR